MRTVFLALASLLVAASVLADMGSIPFNAKAKILEPNQRALIACNGKEQITILTTDLKADRETKVLEIMPFPSEPTIRKADAEVFKKATALINRKLPWIRRKGDFLAIGGASFGGDNEPPAGRVTFHERIGAHDVSTTHVERPEGFVKWARDYLKAQGVENPTIPPALEAVIRDYIRENFTWFVFDVVSLSEKPVTKEALQFRFKTPFMFYPMRITRAEHGDTTVRLLVLSPNLFQERHCLGFPRKKIRLVHRPVSLTGTEVAGLSRDIFAMLGCPENIQIRNWEITGRLDSFKDDLIMGDPRKFIKHLRQRTALRNPPVPPAPRNEVTSVHIPSADERIGLLPSTNVFSLVPVQFEEFAPALLSDRPSHSQPREERVDREDTR
jgi:hypothetical protein